MYSVLVCAGTRVSAWECVCAHKMGLPDKILCRTNNNNDDDDDDDDDDYYYYYYYYY